MYTVGLHVSYDSITMTFLHVLCLLLLASLTSSQTTNCKPGDNCKPPNCRCWNDETIPGGIPVLDTPQVVAVTFEYAVNDANVGPYTDLFASECCWSVPTPWAGQFSPVP